MLVPSGEPVIKRKSCTKLDTCKIAVTDHSPGYRMQTHMVAALSHLASVVIAKQRG